MTAQKPALWIGSSRDDLRAFPDEVRRVMGFAINDAQNGDEHPRAKALKGFGGRSVYVLHAFQKKSKKGIATPKRDIEIIKARLKLAEAHYRVNYGSQQ
jgi:phage-related protein